MAKKGKAKTFLVVLSTLLVVAAAGAAAWGVAELLGYGTSVSIENYFDDLEIATEQYANYTAAAVEPTLDLPDGYTYKIESIKDAEGNEVESAIELGTYTFKVRVIYRASSRTYEIKLTIRDGTSLSVENNKNSTLLKISKQLLTSGTDDSGYEYQEVSYDVNGTLSASAVEGSLSWAETTSKVISDYMTFSIDTTAQTVRLTCLQAFDTQIIFTLRSTELNTATASLTIDYEVKLLNYASNEILYNNSSVYTDITNVININNGDLISISTTGREYSIGTREYQGDLDSQNVTINWTSSQNLNSTYTFSLLNYDAYNYVYITLPGQRDNYIRVTSSSVSTNISYHDFITFLAAQILYSYIMQSKELDFDWIIEQCSVYIYIGETENEAKASEAILYTASIADLAANFFYDSQGYFQIITTIDNDTDNFYFNIINFMGYQYTGDFNTTYGSIEFEESNIIF